MKKNPSLSLKDYVKKTLIDINEGILEAAQDGGVSIAHMDYGESGNLPKCQTVEFNTVVEITESTELNKEIGGNLAISIANFNIGRNKKEEKKNGSVNTVKFAVDAFLGHKLEKKENKN